jgi:D-alanyl-D-alanine carboxypeptidase
VDHAAEHGYIIRYLKGKESITGYQYEPWHIRFVGKEIAKEIMDKGITLEEYLKQAIPVSK